jgi:tape measure domain-containing protein
MSSTSVGTIEYLARIDTKLLKLDARLAESEARKAGDGIGSGIEKGSGRATKALGAMAKFAKVAAIATTAAFTAAVGKFVIAGGISRALNIEDAQAKLKGLGHDAQGVEKIMESALGAVRGTAYGLDAAATTAASAVAAGIKPGKELQKYLTLTADAATIAGVGMDEMGAIMNKVTTGGRAMTDNLNQLSDRGIPIFQWLQDEYKVSAEELRKMVSSGNVDAETFRRVIEKNIGGAALASGSTTRGAWANMQAAMARVGAAIVTDIIPRVRDGFGSMTKWFDDNSDNIVDAVGRVMEIMKDLSGVFIEIGREVGSYLQPKLEALWGIIRKDLAPALARFTQKVILPMAAALGTGLVLALGGVIDGLAIMLKGLTPVIEFLADNERVVWAAVGAFVAFKAAMMTKRAWKDAKDGVELLRYNYTLLKYRFRDAKVWFADMQKTVSNVASMVVAAVKTGVAWTVNAAKAAFAWTVSMAKTLASMAKNAPKMILHAADVGLAWMINAARVSFVWVTQTLPQLVAGFVKTAISASIEAIKTSVAWTLSATKSATVWTLTSLPAIIRGFVSTAISASINAIKTSVAWTLSATRTATVWAVTTLPKIIATFIKMSASAVLHAGIASAAWVKSALTASASFKALAALVATPMVMPALAIAAALTSIALVVKAIQGAIDLKNTMDRALSATKDAGSSEEAFLTSLKTARDEKRITGAEYDRRFKEYMSQRNNYMGTNNWEGGPTWVGERGPEIVDLPKGSRVIPNHDINSMVGGGIENNIGTINIASEADGQKWLRKLTQNQEITSAGLTPTMGLM